MRPMSQPKAVVVRLANVALSSILADVSAGCVRVLDLATFDTLCQFDVAEHAIGQMREHVTPHHHMLAVADTRAGIKVFDLRQPTTHSYACLYQVYQQCTTPSLLQQA